MKYYYAYKESNGTRHEASMNAASRDEVFKELRKQGIKAIKVVAADGSKANGEIRGVRKRVLAASVIGAAILAGAFVFIVLRTPHSALRTEKTGLTDFLTDQTRRQVVGDVAVVEKGIRNGWSEVFPEEGDRFFASFAVPGVKAGQRSTTVEELNAALERRVKADPSDRMEYRQIKAMVEGMKEEARLYVANGGSLVEYGRRLTERQDAEIAIYERTKAEIEAAKKTLGNDELVSLWEKRNDQLRNLGIRLVILD